MNRGWWNFKSSFVDFGHCPNVLDYALYHFLSQLHDFLGAKFPLRLGSIFRKKLLNVSATSLPSKITVSISEGFSKGFSFVFSFSTSRLRRFQKLLPRWKIMIKENVQQTLQKHANWSVENTLKTAVLTYSWREFGTKM